MRIYTFIIFFAFLAACKTPIDWAQECATRYPVKSDTSRSTTIVEKTVTVTEHSTDVVFIDTTICPPSVQAVPVIKEKTVPCPDAQVVYKTRTIRDSITVIQENTAQIEVLQNQLDSTLVYLEVAKYQVKTLSIKNAEQKRQLYRSNGLAIIFIILFLASIYYYLRSKARN